MDWRQQQVEKENREPKVGDKVVVYDPDMNETHGTITAVEGASIVVTMKVLLNKNRAAPKCPEWNFAE